MTRGQGSICEEGKERVRLPHRPPFPRSQEKTACPSAAQQPCRQPETEIDREGVERSGGGKLLWM